MTQENSTLIHPIDQEPWVKIPAEVELKQWSKENEIAYNQKNRQAQKLLFFSNVFDLISTLSIAGDYYEFGCHRARTFRMALTEAKRHALDSMKFYAFDSFEGLPEPETKTGMPGYFCGALKTSVETFNDIIKEHGVYTQQVYPIKGFFNNSLTSALQSRLLNEKSKISIVTVDCDLYESAVPIFDFIEPLLQEGSVIYIDDYFVGYKASPETGPARAFHEFEKKSKFKFCQHMQIGWWGRSFITYI